MKSPYSKIKVLVNYDRWSYNYMKSLTKFVFQSYEKLTDEKIENIDEFFEKIESQNISEKKKKDMLYDIYLFMNYKIKLKNKSIDPKELQEEYEKIKDVASREKYQKELQEASQKIKNVDSREKYSKVRKHNCKIENDMLNEFNRTQDFFGKSNYTKFVSLSAKEPERINWACQLYNKPEIIINEMNVKDERVVVTDFGNFTYINKKTKMGSMDDSVRVTGVSKIDSDNNLVTNEIMIARINPEDKERNKEFFTNIFVADERLMLANKYNNGFIGEIGIAQGEGQYPEYIIECNNPMDVWLVSSLGMAKNSQGIYSVNKQVKKFENFEEYKKELKTIQQNIIQKIGITCSNTKEGDELCQK